MMSLSGTINTTCMYIRWRWMTFPGFMIALTGVLATLVVTENYGLEKDQIWKSLFLAALFCEVEVHDKSFRKEEMFATARSTSVSVEGAKGTLKLVVR